MATEIALILLVALAFPVAAIAGLLLALGLRRRTAALELRLTRLEAQIAAAVVPPARIEEAPSPPEEAAAPPEEETTPERLEPAADEPPAEALRPAPPHAAPAPPDFEEQLGSRWAVWVGGVALALGGILLVRYSIEQGWFGPGARIAAAALFSLALVTAGEWFRRQEGTGGLAGLPSAHVPGVLTAAGTISAFATAYAAHALYGFLGPAAAFALLGAIAVATMIAAALHGPALAPLGLVAALATPLLVASDEPKPWPVVIYLAFVVAAAYGLARLRLWRRLAQASAAGAALWGVVLILGAATGEHLPAMTHVIAQTALAAAFLVADPHRGTSDDAALPDFLALAVMAAFAALAVFAGDLAGDGGTRAAFTGVVAALQLVAGLAFAPAAGTTLLAAAVTAAALALWPVARLAAAEQPTVLPGPGGVPQPEALTFYLGFATVAGLAIGAAALRRLARGPRLPLVTAAFYAAAATTGVLALLLVVYWRVTAFSRSVPFGLAAGLLALAFVGATHLLRQRDDGTSPAIRLGIGATASAALAALALGLTFALDKGMLTVAFALSALAAAFVANRVGIPALRHAVGGVGLVVLGRIAWDPTIAGDDLGRTPILNWLLWGYGMPAASFWSAAQILARDGRDRVTRLCESLAILFAALLVFFEIRHFVHDGDPFAPDTGHVETGLFATTGLLFSLAMVRLDAARPDVVYRLASLAFGACTLIVAGFGLAAGQNPLFTGESVEGGALVNSLLVSYLLPAVAAAALALVARQTRPQWYVRTAAVVALALHVLYTGLEIRRLFQGDVVALWRPTGQAELWAYSAALIVVGALILAVGLLRGNRFLRLASAPYILAAVLKVFLFDLANLEGALRALSFIGLGLVLVAIGLAYQRLLARRPDQAAQTPGAPGA
ncbi:DUF2339 domain-containing protein [Chelatococcus sp. SYSU_G07232]|uniref:DUF2339 domain-containing protein n=1 Tax=Chelatococcus albus TaxID=3047466 RepID=A0ABT7AGJ8_9HYPH|nr:DUF2339 domain-containing protein [Chelatococcus sp. SYSU_G07232]MDJ1157766.1 DUF2339 domain-containing protein [Chelatococcus sp. SYSU_G07232]